MKLLEIQAAIGTAILLLSSPCDAAHKHSHQLQHLEAFGKRHNHRRVYPSPQAEGIEAGLSKRGTCAFPTDAGLVAVTPNEQNAGWAMSPNQPCTPNSYCPYACPSGQVMAQWNPLATSYVYPLSMDGGLYCDSNGDISKPFPDQPYCVDGTGSVGAQNNCGDVVAFCQTVLPGNEAMLIPTSVESWSQLAVPGISYWASTAAHYYINPPGIGTEEACIWSDGSQPLGNWSPYVAGANTDANGNTFAKIGWNPIWTGSGLSGTPPTFGIKIECSGSGCNGLPCSIDPTVDGTGGVTSADQASGAGGANFCVVTIPQGVTANVVVFPVGDSSAGSGSAGSSSSPAKSSSQAPVPSSTSSPSPTPTPTPTTHSSTPPSTTSSSTTSSSIKSSSSSPSSSSTSLLSSTSINTTSPYPTASASNAPHILFQNETLVNSTSSYVAAGTGTSALIPFSANPTASPAATQTATKKNSAQGTFVSSSIAGFAVAFAAAAVLL